MAILSASYNLTPSSPLISNLKDGESLKFEFSHREYNIRISLPIAKYSPKSGYVTSDYYKQFTDVITIDISKNVESTPEIPITDNGGQDFSKLTEYFKPYKEEYAEVAILFYKRLISFFKYQLNQPHLNENTINKEQFYNPYWSNDTGIDYGPVSPTHYVKYHPGLHDDSLSIKAIIKDDIEKLTDYLMCDENSDEIELHIQIISDAQAAILNGNLRRGVFELAIACELAIKRAFFSADTFSTRAFDYFEDKSLLNVPLIDYIHKVARSVFDESFKDYSNDDYKNIEYLISCRNKVAHRGVTTFKYNNETITPDQKMVEAWHSSAKKLLDWLESKKI